jgi:uncharacterized lipoprotein YddW (UPF0748 family)
MISGRYHFHFGRSVAVVLWLLLSMISPCIVAAQTPMLSSEPLPKLPAIRGIWVDGFNEGIKTRDEVDTLIARAQKGKLNAIFAQVRKRGDAYYASRYEPRAKDNRDFTFDPLAYLIERAHAVTPRISVHAWINMGAVGPPNDPNHLLAKHPEYRSLSDTGADYDDEAVKIDPGVPGAADWTFRVYMDVVRRYDVDGIHFDFVRYGGAHWGYAPEAIARFQRRNGTTTLPRFDEPIWQQWRRDQITALVRKVYVNAAAVKPHVVVSAATIAWGDAPKTREDWIRSSAYSTVFQDWRGWLEEGILDMACPMTYFRARTNRTFQENWRTWLLENIASRPVTMAVASYLNPLDATTDLTRLTMAGVVFYSYGKTNSGSESSDAFFTLLGNLFEAQRQFPTISWKTQPTTGHIKGTILTGAELRPVDGVAVSLVPVGGTRRVRRIVRETDGTGFFAAANLLPGEYEISFAYNGETPVPRRVTVELGRVTEANFLLNTGDLPAPRPVYGISTEPNGTRVLLQNRLVTVGTDVLGGSCFLADIAGGGYVEARFSRLPDLPFVAGDKVTLIGTVQRQSGKTIIWIEAAQLVGIAASDD